MSMGTWIYFKYIFILVTFAEKKKHVMNNKVAKFYIEDFSRFWSVRAQVSFVDTLFYRLSKTYCNSVEKGLNLRIIFCGCNVDEPEEICRVPRKINSRDVEVTMCRLIFIMALEMPEYASKWLHPHPGNALYLEGNEFDK